MKYTKILLVYLVVGFSLVAWTMNNWLMIWYLMEVCFVLFMGLCASGKGYSISEVMMMYYLVQVSVSLLMSVFILVYMFNLGYLHSFILILGLMVKMGMFPFHFWFILVCGKLDWMVFFILSTLMKLIPLILVYYLFSISSFFFVTLGSMIFGSFMGLNNGTIQKMMSYSSMINVCWLIYSMSVSLMMFFLYYFSYSIMLWWLINLLSDHNIFYISQFKMNSVSFNEKIVIFVYGLSISGFPPFLGFLIKWLVINYLWYLGLKFMLSLMVMISVLAVYFYLQMFFFVMLLFSGWMKWYIYSFYNFGVFSFFFMTSYIILFIFY
uniref:NADH-ubiquinone oxidoreductase chain 2 n=1 Tax=Bemisia tabaci TaxID=7038 RepID=A0A7S8BEC3_BEMTA|nr:NADH dehydrogenase subunit 2 [Bemisia tabaci]